MKLTRKKAYGLLALSIGLELLGTSCLEASEAFTKVAPTVVVIVAYSLCYWSLSKAMRMLNLSIAYATWTAVGTLGSVLIGFLLFHQTISPVGLGAIAVMIVGVFLLNLYGTPKETERGAQTGTGGEQA